MNANPSCDIIIIRYANEVVSGFASLHSENILSNRSEARIQQRNVYISIHSLHVILPSKIVDLSNEKRIE